MNLSPFSVQWWHYMTSLSPRGYHYHIPLDVGIKITMATLIYLVVPVYRIASSEITQYLGPIHFFMLFYLHICLKNSLF
jgi:hypothetical protein